MLLLPILYKHPKHHFVQLAHHGVDISSGMTFYTDGSCVFPSLPEARLAGFSMAVRHRGPVRFFLGLTGVLDFKPGEVEKLKK